MTKTQYDGFIIVSTCASTNKHVMEGNDKNTVWWHYLCNYLRIYQQTGNGRKWQKHIMKELSLSVPVHLQTNMLWKEMTKTQYDGIIIVITCASTNKHVHAGMLMHVHVHYGHLMGLPQHVLVVISFTCPCGLTFTWWAYYSLCLRHKPTELQHSFYSVPVSVSVLMALSTVFHSINSPDNCLFSHTVLLV